MTIGRVDDNSVMLKFTYDERVEDGLYAERTLKLLAERIENPASWIE